jgi:hypothetical protein
MLRILTTKKNSTTLAGIEPANSSSSCQHSKCYTIEAVVCCVRGNNILYVTCWNSDKWAPIPVSCSILWVTCRKSENGAPLSLSYSPSSIKFPFLFPATSYGLHVENLIKELPFLFHLPFLYHAVTFGLNEANLIKELPFLFHAPLHLSCSFVWVIWRKS